MRAGYAEGICEALVPNGCLELYCSSSYADEVQTYHRSQLRKKNNTFSRTCANKKVQDCIQKINIVLLDAFQLKLQYVALNFSYVCVISLRD